ncbi:MAG TPA: metal-dependent hydrolase [Candidatus Limnocylindrales bacterium]|nr:metal-dependent hydrolase [Candidatus Limnocylindrales bacterium]
MPHGATSITWYGHSCVEIRTPGAKTILLDPWFGNPKSPKAAADVDRCDVMLVSHGHFDHLGSGPRGVREADAISIARRTKPAWPCIHELSLWLEDQLADAGVEIIGMNTGGTVETRGLRISMVHADHSAGDWSTEGEGPLYLGEPVGFVIELEDGSKVCYTGDTALFGDMQLIGDIHRPDLAILPVGGHYTMGPAEAARAVGLLGAGEVMPVHYGTFPILAGTPAALRDALAARGLGGVTVHAPEPGGTINR